MFIKEDYEILKFYSKEEINSIMKKILNDIKKLPSDKDYDKIKVVPRVRVYYSRIHLCNRG